MEASRQVRRQNERRATKPEPGPVQITSRRHLKRTKGLPFSRCVMKEVIPGKPGTPAGLLLFHPTKNKYHVKMATPALLDVFYPGIGKNPVFAASLLGH
jgi:hypothetical protein